MSKIVYELNFELCRDILLWLEEHLGDTDTAELVFEGHQLDNIFYNVKKLHGAGLILATVSSRLGKKIRACWPMEFTPLGEKFLAAAKDEERWSRAVEIASQETEYETLGPLKAALFARD